MVGSNPLNPRNKASSSIPPIILVKEDFCHKPLPIITDMASRRGQNLGGLGFCEEEWNFARRIGLLRGVESLRRVEFAEDISCGGGLLNMTRFRQYTPSSHLYHASLPGRRKPILSTSESRYSTSEFCNRTLPGRTRTNCRTSRTNRAIIDGCFTVQTLQPNCVIGIDGWVQAIINLRTALMTRLDILNVHDQDIGMDADDDVIPAIIKPCIQIRTGGRPKFIIDWEVVLAYRCIGYQWVEIAEWLGISSKTLRRRRDEDNIPEPLPFSTITEAEIGPNRSESHSIKCGGYRVTIHAICNTGFGSACRTSIY
jgi:hypothetical protein